MDINKTLKLITHTFFIRFISILISMLVQVAIIRMLSEESYGSYSLVLVSINVISLLFSFGLPTSNIFYSSKYNRISPYLNLNSLLIACIPFVFILTYSLVYELSLFIVILSLSFLYNLCARSILIGIGRIKLENTIGIISKAVYLALVIWLLYTNNKKVEHVFFALAISFLIPSILYAKIVTFKFTFRKNYRLFLQQRKISLYAYFSSLLSFLVIKSDLYFVELYLQPIELSYYSLSSTMIDYVLILPNIINLIIFRNLSSMKSRDATLYFKKMFFIGIIVSLIIVTISFLLIPFIMPIIIGDGFEASMHYFKMLLPSVIFMTIGSLILQLIASKNYPKDIVFIWALTLCVNVMGNVILIEEMGVNGLIFSTIISSACFMLLTIFKYRYINE